MNDQLRQMVIETLKRGESLPLEWARELFPAEKKEYELIYHGKEREQDILAETMAVPLQPISTFGKNGNCHNMLIFGDNLQAMKTLLKNPKIKGQIKLIYIDPPFATRQEFRGSQEQKAYQDKITGAKFIEFLRKRLVFLRELLADNGLIYVHLDQKKSHYLKLILDEVFGESNFLNEIVWKYTKFQMREMTRFAKNTDRLLLYSKKSNYDFYPITYKLNEAKKLLKKGWDKDLGRIVNIKDENGKTQKITIYDEKIDDLWEIPYIGATAHERTDYPTQKPEKVLERVITSATKEGDLVLDVFAGSGTTCAVAEKLGRRWIAIDSGKLAIYTIQKRMLNLKTEIGNNGKPLKPKPFILYNAGLYDFSTLRKLPWQDWRFFALQLFGCKDEPHKIGGFSVDGKLRGASVMVFNHHEQPNRVIDEETIKDIHAAIGKRIGHKFFIIAPRGVFDFQQDYIDLDDVRYYALRIPYSVINELHHREFTALQQPNDETSVNETVEAVGFDFIQPPHVEWSIGVKKHKGQLSDDAFLEITNFETRARLRGKNVNRGLDALSMIMLDFDYDGNVFDFDVVFYAQQLRNNEWNACFPTEKLGKKMMFIFIDIYGNEAKHVVARENFFENSTSQSITPKRKAKK